MVFICVLGSSVACMQENRAFFPKFQQVNAKTMSASEKSLSESKLLSKAQRLLKHALGKDNEENGKSSMHAANGHGYATWMS